MTLEQYRDELASLLELERMLCKESESLRSEISELSMIDGEYGSATYRKLESALLEHLQMIRVVAGYRVRLASWFWRSRIGNPPRIDGVV